MRHSLRRLLLKYTLSALVSASADRFWYERYRISGAASPTGVGPVGRRAGNVAKVAIRAPWALIERSGGRTRGICDPSQVGARPRPRQNDMAPCARMRRHLPSMVCPAVASPNCLTVGTVILRGLVARTEITQNLGALVVTEVPGQPDTGADVSMSHVFTI